MPLLFSRSFPLATAFSVALAWTPLTALATPAYSVMTLGPLGSGAFSVAGGNSKGMAVGFITDPTGRQVAAEFNGSTATLAGGPGQANAVNSAGTIVGDVMVNNLPTVAEWSNGHFTSLGIIGYGQAINTGGTIAGSYLAGWSTMNAFTYTNGHLYSYGNLGSGAFVSVSAINDAGQLAGTGMTASGNFRAFTTSAGRLRDIGTLASGNSGNSYGLGINNSGTIVGASQTNSGAVNAFVYQNGSMHDLGTLGGDFSAAFGINSAGLIVGESTVNRQGQQDAFLYQNGSLLDLNAFLPSGSGWHLSDAVGIDDRNDIFAIGDRNGAEYALELTASSPVAAPEPAAFALTSFGALLGVALRRRRRAIHVEGND